MATIKIRRTNDYINSIRKYHLFIDGEKIGSISNEQTIGFEVPAGRHSVIARIDWCSSPELFIELHDNDSKLLLVGGFKNGKVIMPLIIMILALALVLPNAPYTYWKIFLILPPVLFLLYFLTLGRKKFLTLREL
jgi:hypothetical protein